jgi:hypothetical protein
MAINAVNRKINARTIFLTGLECIMPTYALFDEKAPFAG